MELYEKGAESLLRLNLTIPKQTLVKNDSDHLSAIG